MLNNIWSNAFLKYKKNSAILLLSKVATPFLDPVLISRHDFLLIRSVTSLCPLLSVCWLDRVGWFHGPPVCYNFLKESEVTLPCSYWSTCFYLELSSIIHQLASQIRSKRYSTIFCSAVLSLIFHC